MLSSKSDTKEPYCPPWIARLKDILLWVFLPGALLLAVGIKSINQNYNDNWLVYSSILMNIILMIYLYLRINKHRDLAIVGINFILTIPIIIINTSDNYFYGMYFVSTTMAMVFCYLLINCCYCLLTD